MNSESFQKKVECIAGKYADLVEKRIDEAETLKGQDLKDIYDSIQMLGHITATLDRFNHIKNTSA